MEARSTKHSPRVDDALAAEVPAISNVVIETAEAPLPGALGEDERRRRSELAMALRPSCFPAQREQLILVAQNEVAPTWVLELLAELPIDTRFDTVQDVWEMAGGHREERDVIELQADAEPESTPGLGSAPSAVGVPTGTDAEPVVTRPRPPAAPIRLALGVAATGIGIGISAARIAIALGRRVVGIRD
jgi:hypothetical protein